MSKHEKSPCKFCDEMVTEYPPLRAAHEKKCAEAQGAEVAVSPEVTEPVLAEPEVVSETPPAPAEVKKLEIGIADLQLQRDIAHAEKVASMRARMREEAPEATAHLEKNSPLVDLEREMIRQGKIGEDEYCFWGAHPNNSKHVSDGKIPITMDGVQVAHGDVRAYRASSAELALKKARTEESSRSRVHGAKGSDERNAFDKLEKTNNAVMGLRKKEQQEKLAALNRTEL